MKKLRVGLAQVPQIDSIETNLAKALDYIEKADRAGVELLCFPETHLAGYRVGVLTSDAPVDVGGLERASGEYDAVKGKK